MATTLEAITPEYDIFLSYAHADQKIVEPLVKTLRLGGNRVFVDAEEIQPGDKWAERIEQAIHSCRTFVILGCCHSRDSEYVAKELYLAVEKGKRVVPMKLCSSGDFGLLSNYQWIDYSNVTNHGCHSACGSEESQGRWLEEPAVASAPGDPVAELDAIPSAAAEAESESRFLEWLDGPAPANVSAIPDSSGDRELSFDEEFAAEAASVEQESIDKLDSPPMVTESGDEEGGPFPLDIVLRFELGGKPMRDEYNGADPWHNDAARRILEEDQGGAPDSIQAP
jgi:hypothetical protein